VIEPGAIYHVTTRGNNREQVVWDDRDRTILLRSIDQAARRHGWIVLAYCLMTNHFHLIVQVPLGGLSEGMRLLNGGFARRMNARHGRVGHLFQNRFHSTKIESDAHLLEACRYVVLNPVRAGLCENPDQWRWSSYRACAGLELAHTFLAVDALLGLFGTRPWRARRQYRTFVQDALVRVSGERNRSVARRRGGNAFGEWRSRHRFDRVAWWTEILRE
jgi:REP element-mobilizing transposase RayT